MDKMNPGVNGRFGTPFPSKGGSEPLLRICWSCVDLVDLVDLGIDYDVVIDGDSKEVKLSEKKT